MTAQVIDGIKFTKRTLYERTNRKGYDWNELTLPKIRIWRAYIWEGEQEKHRLRWLFKLVLVEKKIGRSVPRTKKAGMVSLSKHRKFRSSYKFVNTMRGIFIVNPNK